MASSHPSASPVSPAFAAAYLDRANPSRTLTFEAFMDLALYHPELGYYQTDRVRVGRRPDTDFYTATSSGAVFGDLVAAACVTLLGGPAEAARHTFVEIGAEPAGGILSPDRPHPFATLHTLRLGTPLTLSGPCVVFSNELFDAQPLRRFIRQGSAWHEQGVRLDETHHLHPVTLASPVEAPWLPADAPPGYQFDAPRAAADLATHLAAQPWSGLFLAFDYGKPFTDLAALCPEGTARAYRQHRPSPDLLACPGEQDLTAHVCWDWLADALATQHFSPSPVVSQESFFVHHAGDTLARWMAEDAARFSPRKQAVLQLIHPGNLGQKFQVLHARRA